MKIDVIDLGIKNYKKVLDYQRNLHLELIENRKKHINNKNGYLILVEHPPVITLGKHANNENILFSRDYLEANNVECYHIERGGDVTYHAPGQLVVYPILDIGEFGIGVRKYVELLEETVICLLLNYNIKATRKDGAPGVWIMDNLSERKICALGVKCSHFCTMHGLALNVNTNLDGFSLINPCGFKDKGVTSIKQEKGMDINMKEVKKILSDIFLRLIFSLQK